MTKDQVRLRAANGTVIRLSADEAERFGQGYEPVDGAVVDLRKLKVAELVDYADEHDIDLGDATKKDDVLAAIFAAEDEDEDDTGESAGDDN